MDVSRLGLGTHVQGVTVSGASVKDKANMHNNIQGLVLIRVLFIYYFFFCLPGTPGENTLMFLCIVAIVTCVKKEGWLDAFLHRY